MVRVNTESGGGKAQGWTPPAGPAAQGKTPITGATVASVNSTGAWFMRPNPLPIFEAKDNTPSAYYTYYAVSELEGAYDTMVAPEIQGLFQAVAEAGGGRSGSALFNRYLQESKRLSESGIRKSPIDILFETAIKKGILKDDGTYEAPESFLSDAASGRGTSAPRAVQYRTMANEDDVRRLTDTLASELLGRAVNDKEFKRILNKVRAAEMEQPTVTTTSSGAQTTMQGLTAEGRQDVIREALSMGPEAEEFTKATEMMGLFGEWLDRRPG